MNKKLVRKYREIIIAYVFNKALFNFIYLPLKSFKTYKITNLLNTFYFNVFLN